jgi:hypothetical protein
MNRGKPEQLIEARGRRFGGELRFPSAEAGCNRHGLRGGRLRRRFRDLPWRRRERFGEEQVRASRRVPARAHGGSGPGGTLRGDARVAKASTRAPGEPATSHPAPSDKATGHPGGDAVDSDLHAVERPGVAPTEHHLNHPPAGAGAEQSTRGQQPVQQRVVGLEQRVVRLEQRIVGLEQRVVGLEQRVVGLDP